MLLVQWYFYLACVTYGVFLFLLALGVGCGLGLYNSMDFSFKSLPEPRARVARL